MTIKSIIHSIVENVARASLVDGRLRDLGDFSVRMMASSTSRALSQEKGLSSSARMSISTSALTFVAKAVELGNISDDLRPILQSICRNVIALAPIKLPDHQDGNDEICPEGWSGDPKGPFKKTSEHGVDFVIARRPFLPGGDWALFYGGVAASFGETPRAAADKAELLESLVGDAVASPIHAGEFQALSM